MSTPADIWKIPLLKNARVQVQRQSADIVASQSPDLYENTISSLARQMFFPASGVRRTRVLLAAPGPETRLTGLAEDVANALADLTQASVALIEGPANLSEAAALQQRSELVNGNDAWRRYRSQAGKRVARVPGFVFAGVNITERSTDPEVLPFEYLMFAAIVTDSMFRVFCDESEGVVLALTANQTRKGSAIQAQRIVSQCGGRLLGTVLVGRQFPIPESIYRRL